MSNVDSGRNKDTQANRYVDPEYRKRKKQEVDAMDQRAEELAGPVTSTYAPGYDRREMEISLSLFFQVHDDPEDEENYEPPLAGGDDQLQHLAAWLIGEGWTRNPRHRAEG